ncbi:MAG: hypothetical protein A2X52_00930 [Candidatus Rokubacteria bacterium GWC2_70_16]|nr:MAG: hypothetical protein A2X52_00930 [Candidatus Rokubacteria bacterium GWC2_70_16]OGL19379.1 MAG: hypothetical protein A3K12_00045 [Candidatus Rokubacteria bacterium RIFCSPLOWO2_12_FULL_71_19]
MSVTGGPDLLYVLARRVLLDALEALGEQRTAVILVGAQAIYLHTGEADLAVAPYTTDADLAFVPPDLLPEPRLHECLEAAGFRRTPDIGIWEKQVPGDRPVSVAVDLLVPELLGGPGRRAARLGPHGDRVARKVRGLEAAVVDRARMAIGSLDREDPRGFDVAVAGPAALLVAKLHKIEDRANTERAAAKDALDLLRLLRAVPTARLAARLRVLLRDDGSAEVTREALEYLERQFAGRRRRGALMAAQAAVPLEDPDTIAASCAVLAGDLLEAIRRG